MRAPLRAEPNTMNETLSRQSQASHLNPSPGLEYAEGFTDFAVEQNQTEPNNAATIHSSRSDPVVAAGCPIASAEPAAVDAPSIEQRGAAHVLHVGCGTYHLEKLPPVFQASGWREIRLDIDPEVHPDIVASITDMRVISDGSVDAVYSSHNIEHLYPHDVSLALREMHRVLKPNGFAFIKLPDLQEVARHIADGKLEDPLYLSPMGPIAPLDILYGHRASLAGGNAFMAHRTGFTGETVGSALIRAGFAAALVQRDPAVFGLTALAFRSQPNEQRIKAAQSGILPAPDLRAVLYTSTG
jgi:SAM-dependent methyltransferase